MAGKNTAVFGIYPNRASVDSAVDALKAAEFRNTDISVLFPESVGTKDLLMRKTPKHLKVPRPAPGPVHWWAAGWDGWSALAPWPYPVSDHLSLPARSWRPWLEREWEARSAGSREP